MGLRPVLYAASAGSGENNNVLDVTFRDEPAAVTKPFRREPTAVSIVLTSPSAVLALTAYAQPGNVLVQDVKPIS